MPPTREGKGTIGPRRDIGAGDREPLALAADEMWSMDLVSDALLDRRGPRALTVVEAMTRIASIRGAPRPVRVGTGPMFVSKSFDRRAYENGVTLDFSRPGKSAENAFVAPFNGRLRARAGIEASGETMYDERHLPASLGWPTPVEHAAAAAEIAAG